MSYLINNLKSRRINKIHFIGIGGSGMSGIAEVLYNLGFVITGSDLSKNDATIRLVNLGIKITYSHVAENVAYCDAVVVSSAVNSNNNIEILTARRRSIPIIHRSEMLAELMRFKYGIAVAGTHGKTTTTSLIATILAEGNYDPTFVIGGKLNKFSTNAKLGASEFFVAESDESDGSFLRLNPLLAVITNIDNDHLSNYGNDFSNLKKAFLDFIHKLPFYGLVVVCKDDPVIYNLISEISRPLLSYGFSEQADIRAINYKQYQNTSSFQVLLPADPTPKDVLLNLPGKHNALNALAAIAVALELNIDFSVIFQALQHFHGIDRRFQNHGNFIINNKKCILLDDYGHHPKEILSVIEAIRTGWVGSRLIIVFQPHRYSRTQQLFSEFIQVLAKCDQVILLDIYSASEQPLEEVSSQKLCNEICKNYANKAILISNESTNSLEDNLLLGLTNVLQNGDIVLMQGAGDIGKLTKKLIAKLQNVETVNI